MANRVYKFKDIVETEHFLNGGVFGGRAYAVANIVGKTLIIGATTVTFEAVGSGVDGDQSALRFKDIKAQIEAAVATVDVLLMNEKLAIIEKTPTNGVTVDKDGTANELLGFDKVADTVGKVFAAPTDAFAAPCWTFAYAALDNSHIVYTWE